jgi:hypothetical protein
MNDFNYLLIAASSKEVLGCLVNLEAEPNNEEDNGEHAK